MVTGGHGVALSDTPLDEAEFAALMAQLNLPDLSSAGLAVAVSGGADSMALARLSARWCARRAIKMTALSVDHALREGSAEEAALVAQWLRGRGLAHVTLRWDGLKPRAAIQETARAARYGLLTQWCRGHEVAVLLLAHHGDDQAETALMRLARGSGIDGLACMRPTSARGGIVLARPLLGVSPARLRETLRAKGQVWLEDPSNQDRRYERVRVRQVLAREDAAVLKRTLQDVATKAGTVRGLVDAVLETWMMRHVRVYEAGYGTIDLDRLQNVHRAMARRIVGRVLRRIGGGQYPPNRESLDAVISALSAKDGDRFAGKTLAGCRLVIEGAPPSKDGAVLLVAREARSPALLALSPGRHTFDGRFDVYVQDGAPKGRYLEALRAEGWRELSARAPGLKKHPIPRIARVSLPAVKDEQGVLAVPHLGYNRDWGLACLPVLRHVARKVP